MSAFQSLSVLTSALVHPSVAGDPLERERHRSFIAAKLATTFAALAIAPFDLAYRGAPDTAGAVIFALTLLPLAAATVASRTGRLALAQAIALGGPVGVALTLALGTALGIGSAFACLIVAGTEAALSGERAVIRGALPMTAAVGVLLLLAASRGWTTGTGATTSSATGAALVGILALLYAGPLVFRASTLSTLTRRRLEHWNERERTLGEALDDVVVWLDAAGRVDDASAACEALLGAPATALAGRGLFDRVHVADRPAFLKAIDDAAQCAIHGGAVQTARIRLRPWHAEPRHLRIELRARGLARPDHPTEVVVILRDVTAALEHEAEVERAQRAVEGAARSKDHFIANMSHELRTPLNAIIGFSEMLGSHTLRPADAAKQREYARIINQSGQHLLGVVNSILDMSKIQSGTFAILPEPFAVAPLMDMACEMIALDVRDAGVELVRDYPEALDEIVADKRACKQILLNVLANAVKFTPERGRVTLGARLEGTRLVLTVTDTGIGIAAVELERLGEPFFQARSSLSRPYEGTGLGLSVTRGLVGLHGGTLAISSEPGRGTAVTIRLPLDCRASIAASVAASTAASVAPSVINVSPTIETTARRPPVDDGLHSHTLRMKQRA